MTGRCRQCVCSCDGRSRAAQVESLRRWRARVVVRSRRCLAVADGCAECRPAGARASSSERRGRQAVAARLREVGRSGWEIGIDGTTLSWPAAETIRMQLKAALPGKAACHCGVDISGGAVTGNLWYGHGVDRSQGSGLRGSRRHALDGRRCVPSPLASGRVTVGSTRSPQPPHRRSTGDPGGTSPGRGRWSEGPRGPVPRDPCRAERPALTGAGGFPTIALLRWLRAPSPLERRRSGGHGPRITVPSVSKTVICEGGDGCDG
jgi:hypothetical protein